MFLPENCKTIISMFLATTAIENSTTRIDYLEMHHHFYVLCNIYTTKLYGKNN